MIITMSAGLRGAKRVELKQITDQAVKLAERQNHKVVSYQNTDSIKQFYEMHLASKVSRNFRGRCLLMDRDLRLKFVKKQSVAMFYTAPCSMSSQSVSKLEIWLRTSHYRAVKLVLKSIAMPSALQ